MAYGTTARQRDPRDPTRVLAIDRDDRSRVVGTFFSRCFPVLMSSVCRTCLFKAKLAESIGNALKPEVADGEVASTFWQQAPKGRMWTDRLCGVEISSIALSQVINRVFEQTSYGIHPFDIPSTVDSPSPSPSPNTSTNGISNCTAAPKEPKVPAGLACKRWEVKSWEMIPQSAAGRGFKARDVMQERKKFRELVSDKSRCHWV